MTPDGAAKVLREAARYALDERVHPSCCDQPLARHLVALAAEFERGEWVPRADYDALREERDGMAAVAESGARQLADANTCEGKLRAKLDEAAARPVLAYGCPACYWFGWGPTTPKMAQYDHTLQQRHKPEMLKCSAQIVALKGE